jgi:lactoylglutathione lyase
MAQRARLVGFNHIALEVGDIEEALDLYGRLFEVELRGRGPRMAFIDAGDQFIALSEGRTQSPDDHRHIGLVVDDKRAVRLGGLKKTHKAVEELRRKGMAPE